MPERKSVKNRVHLDVRVADREIVGEERKRLLSEKVEQLVQAGASIAWVNEEREATRSCCATRRATSSAWPEAKPSRVFSYNGKREAMAHYNRSTTLDTESIQLITNSGLIVALCDLWRHTAIKRKN